MIQALPVIDSQIYEKVRGRTQELIGAFPIFIPSGGSIITKMQKSRDWAMLYCFKNSSFFYDKCLYHNWNKTTLKDSILGIERLFSDWYAVDIYVYDSMPLLHLPFSKRRELLEALSFEHKFKLERDLPDALGSRLWSADSLPISANLFQEETHSVSQTTTE
jgi:hypothetical protein